MAKQLVKVQAIATTTTAVRTAFGTVPMFTNADGDADRKAREAKPSLRSAHKFFTDADTAEQLRKAGAVKILDDGSDDAAADDDGTVTIADGAAKTLEANASIDADENDRISGVDTRDTTAFVGGTDQRGGTTSANPELDADEDDAADAPPASDDGQGDNSDAPPSGDSGSKAGAKKKAAPAKKATPA